MGLLSDSQKLITKKFKLISPRNGAIKGNIVKRSDEMEFKYQFPFQRRRRKSSLESAAISERA